MTKPLRISIACDVLEAAKQNNDTNVASACRRVINAWYLGRKHNAEDMNTVRVFAENCSR